MRAMIVVLVACGARGGEVVDDCDSVTRQLATQAFGDDQSNPLAQRCRDDGWNAESRRCLVGLPSSRWLHRCVEDHMTAPQLASFERDALPIYLALETREQMQYSEDLAKDMCACHDDVCTRAVIARRDHHATETAPTAHHGALPASPNATEIATRTANAQARLAECEKAMRLAANPLYVPDDDATLSAESVLAKIRASYMSGIERCYKNQLRQHPDARGKLALAITVDAKGHASGTAAGVAPVDACVTPLVTTWTFPPPTDGKPQTFNVALQLAP